MAHIFQLNCSQGGVPKLAVRAATVLPLGLECDKQAHPEFHGGPDAALCLYSLEHILELQAEGHPIFPGAVGENITVSGLDWATLAPGSRLALGDEVVIEITDYAVPCKSIAPSFLGGKPGRISQKTHPGAARLYARVLQTGRLEIGQRVAVLAPAAQPTP